ncbi:MAG: hypothetical protein A2W26_02390 [Acidobacteria bacterium RBG_16_64_8]|nr:MAG: hypothetical protein A2W26_02390 [Acidobacteria bacterium RBG_16_64_8]
MICDGCNVRSPWEHRCCGGGCECRNCDPEQDSRLAPKPDCGGDAMVGGQTICTSTERVLDVLRVMVEAHPLALGGGGACTICGWFPGSPDKFTLDYYAGLPGPATKRCRRCAAFEAVADLIGGMCVHVVGSRKYYGLPPGGAR